MANILRKRAIIARNLAENANKNDDLKDLYVFGYQCKLFRDDERALYIDQGKHLIPWMGNNSLMIDRYDGRGHLHDLKEFDADVFRGARELLTDEERHIEALCDEERYLELNSDILEKMLYEEEELKRLNEALAADGSYTAVSFSYGDSNSDGDSASENQHATEGNEEDDCRPYVPIPELQLPSSIQPPRTAKMHAIIERTAVFIAKHGVQMEIMMKTKQKDNPQFAFLDYEHELNAYYKFLVQAIKQNKYMPASNKQSSAENDSTQQSYLHPSLSSSVVEAQPQTEQISRQEFLESVSAKLPAGQIANTLYAKLLSNLSKHTRTQSPRPTDASVDKTLPSVRSAPSLGSMSAPGSPHSGTSNSFQSSRVESQPPVPGLEPVALPSSSSAAAACINTAVDKTRGELANGPAVVPPTPDIQPVIDKMAEYVARNGPEFEIVVRRRHDTRFNFIEPSHQYYAYYCHKKNLFMKEIEKKRIDEEKLQCEKHKQEEIISKRVVTEQVIEKDKSREQSAEKEDKFQVKAVSFMIRTKEEEAPLLQKMTALPYESSDDDDDDEQNDNESDSSHSNAPSLPFTASVAMARVLPSVPPHSSSTRSAGDTGVKISTQSSVAAVSDNSHSPVCDKTSLSDDAKKHDRLADKLAIAARDRFLHATREKQLQAQRKRKAAAFLTMMKKSNVEPPADGSTTADSAPASCAGDVPPSPLSVHSTHSRSSTPGAMVQAQSPGTGPFMDKFLSIASASSSARPSPVPTKSTAKHRHRSRSPKRHHKHRSRSRSPHERRSRSPSRKHRKRDTKLPCAYTENQSRSRSPKLKSSHTHSPVRSSKHSTVDGEKHRSSTSRHKKTHSSSSKHHRKSDDSDRRHKSKKQHKKHRSRHGSSSSSWSPTPAKRSSRLQDNLIDLTISDKHRSSSVDSIASDSVMPIDVDAVRSSDACPELSEVQALLKARREQLLKEDVVILD